MDIVIFSLEPRDRYNTIILSIVIIVTVYQSLSLILSHLVSRYISMSVITSCKNYSSRRHYNDNDDGNNRLIITIIEHT